MLASARRAYSSSAAARCVVPVIDFAPFAKGTAADKKKVAQTIGDACEHIGFLVIKNHGVSQPVINAAWTETRKFFDLSADVKEKYTSTNESEYPYGYVGFGKEVLSAGKVCDCPCVCVCPSPLPASPSVGLCVCA